MNKKKLKRLLREGAELEAKEREETLERQKTIADLFQAIVGMECRQEQPREGILAVARELAQQWTFKKRPVFEGSLENKRLLLLVALVVALKRDHEFLEPIRQYYPKELENLSDASGCAWLRESFPGLFDGKSVLELIPGPGKKKYVLMPKSGEKKYEETRRLLDRVGEIECLFGSEPPKSFALGTARLLPGYDVNLHELFNLKPPRIDVILLGGTLNMSELQELFGMNRSRLRRYLKGLPPKKDGIKRRYDVIDVVKIMRMAALSEKLPERESSAKGRPRRLFLGDAVRRHRVFEAIVHRAVRIGAAQKTVAAFKDLAFLHRSDSGKK